MSWPQTVAACRSCQKSQGECRCERFDPARPFLAVADELELERHALAKAMESKRRGEAPNTKLRDLVAYHLEQLVLDFRALEPDGGHGTWRRASPNAHGSSAERLARLADLLGRGLRGVPAEPPRERHEPRRSPEEEDRLERAALEDMDHESGAAELAIAEREHERMRGGR